VIRESHTERQTTLLVRANGHVYDACWEQHEVDLEEIVLAYLGYTPGMSRWAAGTEEVVPA
jgi:ABC-2 type transport system ATP-binding protein